MKRIFALLLAASVFAPAPAMSVAEFLGKVDGLYAKGPMALFSSDLKLVKAEGIASTKAWRAQAHAPNACPPATTIPLDRDEYVALLRAVPAAQRQESVTQAVTTAMNKRYPCA